MENIKNKVCDLINEYRKYEEEIREIEEEDREYRESSGDYFAGFAVRNQIKFQNKVLRKIKKIFKSYPCLCDDDAFCDFVNNSNIFKNKALDFDEFHEYVSDDYKFVVGRNNIIDSLDNATLDNFVILASEDASSVCSFSPISEKGNLEVVSYLERFPFLLEFCDDEYLSDFDFSRFYKKYEDYKYEKMLRAFDEENLFEYFGDDYSGYPDDDFSYDRQNEYDVWERVIRK